MGRGRPLALILSRLLTLLGTPAPLPPTRCRRHRGGTGGPHGLDLSDRRRTLRGRFRRVWLLRISPHRRRRRRQWCSARRHSSRFFEPFEPFVIEGNFVRCPTGRRAGAPRLHEIGLAGEAVGGDVFVEVPGGGDAYCSSMSFTIGTTIVRLQ